MLWKEGFAVDSLCAERNAPSLVSATLPPHFTQASYRIIGTAVEMGYNVGKAAAIGS